MIIRWQRRRALPESKPLAHESEGKILLHAAHIFNYLLIDIFGNWMAPNKFNVLIVEPWFKQPKRVGLGLVKARKVLLMC